MTRTSISRLCRVAALFCLAALTSLSLASGLLTEVSFGVTSPNFVQELGISGAQVQQIEKLMRSYANDQTSLSKKNASDEAYDKLDEEYSDKIVGLLNAAQKARLRQIALQIEGPSAIARAEVAQELGVAADARAKIATLAAASKSEQEELDTKIGDKLASIPGPKSNSKAALEAYEKQKNSAFESFKDDQKRVDAAKEQNDAKILAMLTASQKAKWQQMLGKKFAA